MQRVLAATLAALAVASAAPLAFGQDPPPEIVAPAARDVTPPGVTPGPAGDGPLIRVPTPPKPPEPARWHRFFLPRTTNAATFKVRNRTIRIAGVAAPAPDEACRRREGSAWPCGRTALHALRMFLRGRAIECFFPFADSAVDITAPCRVGSTDLGLWLLTQGWVKPGEYATEDYEKAARAARCAKRGLWRGTDPVGSCGPATPG